MGKHEDMLFEGLKKKEGKKKVVKVKAKSPIYVRSASDNFKLLKYVAIAVIIILILGLLFKLSGFKVGKEKTGETTQQIEEEVKTVSVELPPPPPIPVDSGETVSVELPPPPPPPPSQSPTQTEEQAPISVELPPPPI